MSIKRFLAPLAPLGLVTALALGGVALAGPGMGGGYFRAAEQLDLSDEQVETLQSLKEQAKADREGVREQMKANREAMRAQLESDEPDAAVLHDLVDEAAAIRTQMAHDRIDDVLEVHATLTPQQRAELFDKLEERREHFQERRGEMRERRGEMGERRGGERMRHRGPRGGGDDLATEFGKL